MSKKMLTIGRMGLLLIFGMYMQQLKAQEGVPIGGCKEWRNGGWVEVPCATNSGGGSNYNSNRNGSSNNPSAKQRVKSEARDLNEKGILANEKGRNCWEKNDLDCAVLYFKEAIEYYRRAKELDNDKIYRENLERNENYLVEINKIKSKQAAESVRIKEFKDAKTLLDVNKWTEAITALKEYLSKYPNGVYAAYTHYYLFLAYKSLQAKDKFEEAYNEYQKALEMDPTIPVDKIGFLEFCINYASKLNWDGVDLSDKGQFKEAELIFAKAAILSPYDKQVLMNLGLMQTNQDNFKNAEVTYRKILAFAPDDIDANLKLGYSLFGQNRLKEAEDVYRHTTILDPNDPDAFFDLALVLGEEKIIAEADANFKKSIQLRPDIAKYRNYYAAFLEKAKNYQEAAYQYEQSLLLENTKNYARTGLINLITEKKIEPIISKDFQFKYNAKSAYTFDDIILTEYKDAPKGVVDRVRKGFQAIEASDWEVAKAWFGDALLHDKDNPQLKRLIDLGEFTINFNKSVQLQTKEKIEYDKLTDQEKNLLNVWIQRARETAKDGVFKDLVSDIPAPALDNIRKYVYGLSDVERDKLFFPEEFLMDLFLFNMMKK